MLYTSIYLKQKKAHTELENRYIVPRYKLIAYFTGYDLI